MFVISSYVSPPPQHTAQTFVFLFIHCESKYLKNILLAASTRLIPLAFLLLNPSRLPLQYTTVPLKAGTHAYTHTHTLRLHNLTLPLLLQHPVIMKYGSEVQTRGDHNASPTISMHTNNIHVVCMHTRMTVTDLLTYSMEQSPS
jgi:hypothetical protein